MRLLLQGSFFSFIFMNILFRFMLYLLIFLNRKGSLYYSFFSFSKDDGKNVFQNKTLRDLS